jgi:hypothetical protein
MSMRAPITGVMVAVTDDTEKYNFFLEANKNCAEDRNSINGNLGSSLCG